MNDNDRNTDREAPGSPTERQVGSRSGKLWATFMAAAMFVMVAFLLVGSKSSEHWVVTDADEGSPYAVGERLVPGVLTVALGEELEVQLGDRLRIRLPAGATVELPRPPGRWIDQVRGLTVTSVEIDGTTGGRPLGFPLTVVSDEVKARVRNATFAVLRNDEVSCVCLWEGGITAVPLVGTQQDVELRPQQRVWVYRDGREPAVMPLDPVEVMKLKMMSNAGIPVRD
jgi:hypothetical protein